MSSQSNKIVFRKILYPLLWFMAAVLCFVVQWCVFRSAVYDDSPSILGTVVKGVAEGMLLLSWYWFLPPRYRWWLQMPLWICGLLFLSNVLYYRVFDDLIPLSSVSMTDNFNLLFFRSSLALFRWSDLILLLMPLCITFSYRLFFASRVRRITFSWLMRILAFVVCIFIWSVQQGVYIFRNKHDPFVASCLERGENGLSWIDAIEYQFVTPDFNSRVNDLHSRGMAVFTIREIYRSLIDGNSAIQLTDLQLSTIDDYLSSRPKDYPIPAVFNDRDSMNVVLIIVESLNSWVFSKEINGMEITPNLNRMISLPNTIFLGQVNTETRDGGSSDGQLIYDTGLLPLTIGAAAISFPTQVYPSLASILSRKTSSLFIADNRKVWNYESASKQYGYTHLYDEEDLVAANLDPEDIGRDKALFAFAADILVDQPQPFFAEIITLSMHLPFREEAVERLEAFDSSGHSSTFNDYITAVRFFDSQFGGFVDKLKEAGIYDDTIIFLASDHDILVQDQGYEDIFDKSITFIAINAAESHTDIYGEVYQSDIFPTMLDIAGRADAQWKGLGTSIFAQEYRKRADSLQHEQAQNISDLIIRGSYFDLK